MQSLKILTLIVIIFMLNSTIFEFSFTEKVTKSVELFVDDLPPNALKIYIWTETAKNKQCAVSSTRKIVVELHDCSVLGAAEIVQLVLSKRRTKNGDKFVYLRIATKLLRGNDPLLKGHLYPLPLGPISFSVVCIAVQIVEGSGKRRLTEFELGEFEKQSFEDFILFEVKIVRRKGS